jgi:hypothetical protein
VFQQSIDRPLIFALDEYPFLRDKTVGLDSILQSLIDEFKGTSHLKLILCGSYVDIMQKLLEHSNPLYGRLTLTMQIKQMDYYEASAFYPTFQSEEKVELYSVFGGVPYYCSLIDPSLSVRENIISLISSTDARLENEVQFYIRNEIAKISNANSVFDVIANDCVHFSDILNKSGMSSSPALADILKRLTEMEILEKKSPINQMNNSKRVQYVITDNLSAFYYRYVFHNATSRQLLNEDVFFDRYIKEDFSTQFVPHAFENICRQFLIRCNQKGYIKVPFDVIGSYYYDLPKEHKNGEFDVVTKDPNGYISYEAKYTKAKITDALIENEINQVNSSPLKCYQYGFFSKNGYQLNKKHDCIMYTLSDLYSKKIAD